MIAYYGDHVSWATSMLNPVLVGSNQVTGVIPASDLGAPQTFQVWIHNPEGQHSNDVPFTVT
jgi:hypothetical protein